MNVSVAKNMYAESLHTVDLMKALDRIREGKSKDAVELVRQGDKSSKKKLPMVMFSGEFSHRKDVGLQRHSGMIVLDFDNLENVEDSKMKLATDEHSFATWISPSGNGVKVLVRVTNPENHDKHFRALHKYYDKAYGLELDTSGVNVSRGCYESYDPNIVINEQSKKFGGMLSEKSESQKAEVSQMTDYMKLNIAATMVRDAKEGERHAKLLRAARLCGGYIAAGRMEEGVVMEVLLREFSRREFDRGYNPDMVIRDGIESGKMSPLSEILSDEKKIKREQMVESGDLSFISSDEEDMKWMSDFLADRIQVGLTTGDERMDRHFVYKRDFTIINGISNVGKTSFALYMMMNASMRHGWKWLVYSAENKTASIKMKLLEYAMGRKIKGMTADEIREGMSWLSKHFIVITNKDVVSYLDLLIYAERLLANDITFDGFFIDPYNALRIDISSNSGINTHEYHYEAASELLTFSNGNEKAVWLNVHAFTSAQRKMGDDGHVQAPQAPDTEGGGKFVNRADNFLTFHRKTMHEDMNIRRSVEFHVRKVREVETGGEPTPNRAPLMFRLSSDGTQFFNSSGLPVFSPLKIEERQSEINLEQWGL